MNIFKNKGCITWAGLARVTSLSLALPVCVFASGCIGEAPVRAERNCSADYYMPSIIVCKFTITPLVDSVVIKSITGNRKQCNPGSYDKSKIPFKGKFGEAVTVTLFCPNSNKVLELGVETNQGDWDFSFQ